MILDVTQRIKLIRPRRTAIFPYSNSVYIDDDLAVLIDAGAGAQAYIDIDPEKVGLLLLSHIHYDHIHNVGLFKNARIAVAKEEAGAYNSPDEYFAVVGLNLWEKFMGDRISDRLVQSAVKNDDVGVLDFETFKVSDYLWDGRVFDFGHIKATVIHTPGHSPGHYAFYFEPDDVLFSSDLDLAPLGPWYGGGRGDFQELETSIRKLMAIKPAKLITSHRRIFDSKKDDIAALFQTYLDVALAREEMIRKSLTKPLSLEQLIVIEFERDGYPDNRFQEFWIKVMFHKHLQNLQKKGIIKELADGRWVQD